MYKRHIIDWLDMLVMAVTEALHDRWYPSRPSYLSTFGRRIPSTWWCGHWVRRHSQQSMDDSAVVFCRLFVTVLHIFTKSKQVEERSLNSFFLVFAVLIFSWNCVFFLFISTIYPVCIEIAINHQQTVHTVFLQSPLSCIKSKYLTLWGSIWSLLLCVGT